MYNFCALFNSDYLSRGLAMYETLDKYCDDYHLYIFAFDIKTYFVLIKLNLPNVTVIALKDFENKELLSVKKNRSKVEYCWTSTPWIIHYCIKNYHLKNCTYLDADLYFFSDPKVLIDEIGDKSILIIEHRYTPRYNQIATSGKYCVQFVTFKNNKNGMKALNWWKDSCIEWCYSRAENGKFGDQKYLDDWCERFEGVYELQALGGGVAPWNVQQYNIFSYNDKLYGIEKSTGRKFDLVFYHFHNLKFLGENKFDLSNYRIDKNISEIIYKPYIKHLLNIETKIRNIDNSFIPHKISEVIINQKTTFEIIKRVLKCTYNIYTVK